MSFVCDDPNNFTDVLTTEEFNGFVRLFAPYIFLGGFAVFANMFIVYTVWTHKHLHQNYFLTAALAVGDWCNGMAFFTASFYRFYWLYAGILRFRVTPWICVFRTHVWFFMFGNQMPIGATLFIAIERLLAVIFPMQFTYWPVKKYTTNAVVFFYLFCVVSVGGSFYTSYIRQGPEDCLTNVCMAPTVVGRAYSLYNYGMSSIAGLLAIFIYIAAMIAMKLKMRELVKKGNQAAQQQLKRQARMTRMMGAIVTLSAFLVVAPCWGLWLQQIIGLPDEIVEVMAPKTAIFFCVNSCINIFVYAITNPELRSAFGNVLCCRPKVAHDYAVVQNFKGSYRNAASRIGKGNKVEPSHSGNDPKF